MKNYEQFDKVIDNIEKAGLAKKSLIRFARKELGPPESRLQVYRAWVYFKRVRYKEDQISAALNRSKIPTLVILGDKDFIVPAKEIKNKTKKVQTAIYFDFPAKHHHLFEPRILLPILS